MGVEAIKNSGRASSARVVCDTCGKDEAVPCGYNKRQGSQKTRPNESQARAKALALGWSYLKGKLRCPACEAKRKVAKDASAIRRPTREQKRQIIQLLDECYDTKAERYMQGETDDTVADVLSVMPGWVSEIREELFGPDGGNEDIEALVVEIDEWRTKATAALDDMAARNEHLVQTLAEAKLLADALERIKAAVGPRSCKKAGI